MSKWAATLYGFVELDAIHDSTESFNDTQGNGAIAHADSYAANHGRTTFGVRNSRFGVKVNAPEVGEFKTSGILEMDLLGNQPTTATEAQVFTNPGLRVRHFALKVEDPYIDFLFGQYWQLFGWQGSFHPNTVEIQGVPGEVFGRAPQIRLAHTFKSEAVNVELAVAASRPPQRDSEVPDGQAGARLLVNGWKGLRTAGSTGTSSDPLAIGVSAVGRKFNVTEFSAAPKEAKSAKGWGLSIDALLPIIPATMKERGNALTLTGSFVTGAGIADLYSGLTGGVSFPALPNPNNANPAPAYTANIDNGLVTYGANGALHTIKWQSFIVGAQYYLPPSGHVWISGNYSHLSSSNAADYVNTAGQAKIFTKMDWADGNLFWDATAAVRLGAEYAYTHQTYADGTEAKNHRAQFSAFYIF